jgi:hypothetical protein
LAHDQIPGDASKKPDLTVLVYIYAPIPQEDLGMAERVASNIFQKVGVELSWVDCPMTRQTAPLNPACTTPYAPTDIHVIITPDLMEWAGSSAMGVAMTAPPPNRGKLAYVSYARATRLLPHPRGVELTLGELLGHGIAHEIGHLLLGTNSHSPSGLMSARWNREQLKLAACGQLTFLKDQAVAIRGDVRARRAQQEAAGSEQAASQK